MNDIEKQAVRQKYTDGASYFFYAGAIHPRKNIPRLIRAFDQYKQRTGGAEKLLLAGRFAWHTGDVKQAYDQSAFKGDIVFLGYVPDDELPVLLGAALALTYVSLSEGFGLPLLEAFHAEAPVITANTTALPEVAGDAALLVDPVSVDSIAHALQQVAQHEQLRQSLVEKGRLRRQKFDWDLAAELIYQTLVSTAGRLRK